MDESLTPDVSAPSAVDVTNAPNGSEAVINSGSPEEQAIPFARFQEVNNSYKEAQEQLQQYEERIKTFETQALQPKSDIQIDEDTRKILDTWKAENGFVSKADLEAVEKQAAMKSQVLQDVQDLKGQFKDYDHQKVMDYAKQNNMSANSKSDLKSIYRDMNYDTSIESARKSAIAEFQEAGRTTAETNGSSALAAPQAPQVQGTKSRIQMAAKKLGL